MGKSGFITQTAHLLHSLHLALVPGVKLMKANKLKRPLLLLLILTLFPESRNIEHVRLLKESWGFTDDLMAAGRSKIETLVSTCCMTPGPYLRGTKDS